MKLKLMVSKEKEKDLIDFFAGLGIEIDDDADLVLTEKNRTISYLPVKDSVGDRQSISVDEIIFMESFGHDVTVHTGHGEYMTQEPLGQLIGMLDPTRFLRISNSCVISARHVKKIKPLLSMKYSLTMSNKEVVEVTRSYSPIFRDFFNI